MAAHVEKGLGKRYAQQKASLEKNALVMHSLSSEANRSAAEKLTANNKVTIGIMSALKGTTMPETENVALNRAAPDLYKALKWFVDWVSSDECSVAPYPTQIVVMAMSALDKADGKQE